MAAGSVSDRFHRVILLVACDPGCHWENAIFPVDSKRRNKKTQTCLTSLRFICIISQKTFNRSIR